MRCLNRIIDLDLVIIEFEVQLFMFRCLHSKSKFDVECSVNLPSL